MKYSHKQYLKTTVIILSLLLCLSFGISSQADAVPVKIIQEDGRFQLIRGGEPYEVRGAGLELADIGVLASHGGNSIRTWSTENPKITALEVLDNAAKHGVTVAMCIEIGRERLGFDYEDEEAVAAQLEFARDEVIKYKDHPALLAWIIGNEVNLSFKNPKVFDAINDISRMIHEVDPNHPTTTALAGFNRQLAELVETRASDLDFVSMQMYADVVNLPRYVRETGYKGPYAVTEWGSRGHWEVGKTSWGAPIEQNSSEKAANYLKSYKLAIASNPDQVIASYVFLWGQKQERTPTWYGMFLPDGSETETIDVMHYLWNGTWPDNRSPQIKSMKLDAKTSTKNIKLDANGTYKAKVKAQDPDGDELQYHWEILHESKATQEGGDREEVPKALTGLMDHSDTDQIVLKAPAQTGAYRLFVYVRDGQGNAGHANIPFLVE
ncbi:MAG: glycoside hydrolase family 2 TIM barrel-domain containing protein [Lysobacterales bacterium]